MLRRFTRVLVISVVAAVFATVAPVFSQAAPAPCQGRIVDSQAQTIALTGLYRGDGYETRLTCGIVQNGVTVVRVTDRLFGPVAALADSVTVPAGAFTVCWDIYISYIDGSTQTRTCP